MDEELLEHSSFENLVLMLYNGLVFIKITNNSSFFSFKFQLWFFIKTFTCHSVKSYNFAPEIVSSDEWYAH
jgi:hypothetical protein